MGLSFIFIKNESIGLFNVHILYKSIIYVTSISFRKASHTEVIVSFLPPVKIKS